MICVKCGTQNNDGSKFCKGCGTALSGDIPSTPQIEQSQYQPLQHAESEKTQILQPIYQQSEQTQIPQSQIPQSQIPQSQIPQSQIPQSQIPQSQIPPSRYPKQEQPYYQQPVYSVPDSEDSGKKKTKPATIILIIAIAIALLAVLGILAYILLIKDGGMIGKDSDEQSEITTEANDDGNADSEIGDEDSSATEITDADGTETDESAIEGELPDETVTEDNNSDSANAKSWQEAYLDYINDTNNRVTVDDADGYALIYVNNDEVPELVFKGDCEAAGCLILTYANGVIDELQTSRLNFDYIERGNVLCNSDGHSDYYYDHVFSIEDGYWVNECSYEYSCGFVGDSYEVISNSWTVYGTEATESEYNSKYNELYQGRTARYPEYVPMNEIRSQLSTGTYASAGHRYELVIQDVSWAEAEAICRNKGGYLANITCMTEFNNIVNQIRSEDKTKYVFYVGGTRMAGYGSSTDTYSYRWVHENEDIQMGYYGDENSRMWHPNEPSYSGENSNGDTIDENCVDIYFNKNDGRAYLNDVSEDILAQAPFYKGIVGFICEYDY